MLVKDQLQVRMDQLKVSVNELAKRIGVSNQSVRHWLSGRSFPGKRHLPALEKALSFRLDFSEGDTPAASPTVESTLQKKDIELFLKISRLAPEMKMAIMMVIDAALHQQQQQQDVVQEVLPPVSGSRHSTVRQARPAAR